LGSKGIRAEDGFTVEPDRKGGPCLPELVDRALVESRSLSPRSRIAGIAASALLSAPASYRLLVPQFRRDGVAGCRGERAPVAPFELYVLRHTCLTRWAKWMDPCTFRRVAGHADMHPKRCGHGRERRKGRKFIERKIVIWSHPPGSNRRPADYESAALPTELGWLAFVYNSLRAVETMGNPMCARFVTGRA
jgi:hypothetical protein